MVTEAVSPARLSWDLAADARQLFSYHFMVNALVAGTAVAVMAACVGWFMVLRRQAFAGHTLSVIAFPGGAAAALAGAPALVGYFGFCGLGSLLLSAVTRAGHSPDSESGAIGSVQALALGLGFLFVTLYGGVLSGVGSLLFGTFLGIDDGQVLTLLLVTAGALLALALAGRPLLFASLDPAGARAAGVPVGALSVGYLLALGLAVGATAQITGALLVFALLVTPPATAQALSARPARSLVLSVTIAVSVTWLGLAIAYFSVYPVGFWVTSLSFGAYLSARGWRALSDRAVKRRHGLGRGSSGV